MRKLSLALLGSFVLSPALAQAQSVEQFYKGRTIKLSVGSPAGGGTDIMARLLARHIGLKAGLGRAE